MIRFKPHVATWSRLVGRAVKTKRPIIGITHEET